MLKKGKGKINEIVYNNTVYHNGMYHFYPTISDLNRILDEIIASDSMTEILMVMPFYINEQIGSQIEFQEYLFCLECRESVDAEVQKQYIVERLGNQGTVRYPIDTAMGKILYPLCQNQDTECFKQALILYKAALRDMLLHMMKIARIEMDLQEEDLHLGTSALKL